MARSQPRNVAQDILSREVGYIRKPHAGRLRIALAFPNTYHVGMSNLGFQTVYRLFNEPDDVVCERVFLPPGQGPDRDPRPEPGLRARSPHRERPLVTVESNTPVSEFDVLALSVSFEWDYTHILTLLRLAGIPAYAEARGDRHPLVVLGGAISFLNPEPVAPFVDVVAVGEGELLVPSLIRAILQASGRADLLRRLATEPGMYVPSLVEVRYGSDGRLDAIASRPGAGHRLPVRKLSLEAAAMGDPPATTVFTPDTEFGSRFLIEVVRGCANLCRFCWAGYNYLPVRAFDADRVLRLAERARTYASRVGLVSIALCDHPDIERILARLHEMDYAISPASLRLDDLTEPFVRLLRAAGERTITLAPETGSDRLRRVINKRITNEQIVDRADLVFRCGIQNLKLYFMIGLPTEDDEDLVAIRDLSVAIRERMLAHARSRGSIGRITASVNPLVPKPGTAYETVPLEPPPVIERKMRRLRHLVRDIDNVQFTIKSERHTYYQALLSLGDRRLAPVIEAAERNGGQWRAAAAEAGIDTDWYLFRDRGQDPVLPWDTLEGGVGREFLRAELVRSLGA